jgi:hypothetical protein
MKLLKKFKDYLSEPKIAYSALELTKKELEYVFSSLLEELDYYSFKSLGHRYKTDKATEEVNSVDIECVTNTDKFEEVSKLAHQAIKRFNGMHRDIGLIAQARVTNLTNKGGGSTKELPTSIEDLADYLNALPQSIKDKISFHIAIYNPKDYVGASARSRGIKEKPIRGYPFYVDYL